VWNTDPLRELYGCAVIVCSLTVAIGAILAFLAGVELAKEVIRGE